MDKEFKQKLLHIALPVTIQALMQSSLNLIDQIMIGSLGSACIAGIGLAGKFTSILSVLVAAIVTAAGILISQYFGAKNEKGVRDSFYLPFYFSLLFVLIFSILSFFIPNQIMSLLDAVKKHAESKTSRNRRNCVHRHQHIDELAFD